ncbi:MAG: YhdP family protein [Burkholderiaceae bacterium]
MPPNSAVIDPRRPRRRAPRRLLAWAVGALVLLWSLLLLAWLILHWGILPHIDEWRPRIEALASRAIGAPVVIGRVEVRSRGWVPAAELDDVVLLDAQGREALRLPRVTAALSVPALLALELRFEQLLVDGAQIEVRRDAQGRIRIAGLATGGAGDDGNTRAAADWFFRQHEFVIRGGSLLWIDEQRQSPQLALTDAVVVVRNGLLHHELRIDATPPAAWGERFSLRARAQQPLMARAGDWRQWSGTVYAELPHVDVAQLRQLVDLPFDLREGRGALRAWLDLDHGDAGGATVDVALRDVALRLSPQVGPMQFEYLRTRLAGERNEAQVHVSAERLAFATGDGVEWPESRLDARWRLGPAKAQAEAPREVVGGEVHADRLDLALMAALAARVPLGDSVRKLLAELAPRGVVNDLAARWEGPLDAPAQYQVRARMKGLAIAAAPAPEGVGRPGWTNADVELQASELGGDARLTMADGAMEFPGVFERPLVPLRRFDAQLVWRVGAARPQGRAIEVQVKEARFENDDAAGELSAQWRTGDGAAFGRGGRFPGQLDLQGRLTRGVATSVARYLPVGLPRSARDYVRFAVQGGSVSQASFKVKGDVYDFPYNGARSPRDGEFRIAARAADVTFAYVPSRPAADGEPAFESPWPAITRASGELVFDRASMSIRNAQGRIFGVDLRGVNGNVRDFADQPALEIEGQARGPLADMLRYVHATPVGGWIGGALGPASGQGAAELQLALNLPFARLAQSTVNGSVQLAGNDVRLRPDTPLFAAARGRVEFTDKGVQLAGVQARVLGGDATLEGGTQADGQLRFTAQGTASAEALRRMPELGLPARLATLMQGQSPYRFQLGFVKGHAEFALTSPLTGMAIDLPAPLGKTAEASLPLRVQASLLPEAAAAGTAARDQLRVELGPAVQALFVRDVEGDVPKVLRSAIGVGAAPPAAVVGGQAVVDLASLDLDAWRAAWSRVASGAAKEVDTDSGFVPQQISAKVRQLTLAGRRITGLSVDLARSTRGDEDLWRARIAADQLAGQAEYHDVRGTAVGDRVFARLTRLSLPPAEVEGVEQLLDQAPATVPALDIVVDDFELRGKRLGRLEVEAVNRAGSGADSARDAGRVWQLDKLALRTPEATLTATGRWAPVVGSTRRRMEMDFELELADSGAYLERLGYGKTLRGGKGQLQGQLAWSGSPLAWDTRSLDGTMNLSLDAGQFLKADAGAARLLGVLSLQSLPRRLALDFRDLFQEGFPFDNIGGDFRLTAGIVQTNNLRMRGVQAAVLMEGKADIGRETQDLRVIVVPEINAGTASLAYAAINPALGIGTFLAQWLLRRPLIAANTREFHITGGWDDPKVERIERKPGDAVPDPDAPSAAASSPPRRP